MGSSFISLSFLEVFWGLGGGGGIGHIIDYNRLLFLCPAPISSPSFSPCTLVLCPFPPPLILLHPSSSAFSPSLLPPPLCSTTPHHAPLSYNYTDGYSSGSRGGGGLGGLTPLQRFWGVFFACQDMKIHSDLDPNPPPPPPPHPPSKNSGPGPPPPLKNC